MDSIFEWQIVCGDEPASVGARRRLRRRGAGDTLNVRVRDAGVGDGLRRDMGRGGGVEYVRRF